MMEEKLDIIVLKKLELEIGIEPKLNTWKTFLSKLKNPKNSVKIGLVGKYVELKDSYKSIAEGLIHAGAQNECSVEVDWIHSESINSENASEKLSSLNGILVAPGFGERGVLGKLAAVKYARESNIPFFGICLGMQCAVVEFAQNVLGLSSSSREIDNETQHPVIDLMEEQKKVEDKGGTMRLGAYSCNLEEGSFAHKAYGSTQISERHRHRYEFNSAYKDTFEKAGMKASGINLDTGLVEIIEIPNHPYFIGVQFHPEYKSTVANPHPLFIEFVKAAIQNR
jgi:CTP synthase